MSGERPAWHSSVAGTCGGMTALSTWFPVSQQHHDYIDVQIIDGLIDVIYTRL